MLLAKRARSREPSAFAPAVGVSPTSTQAPNRTRKKPSPIKLNPPKSSMPLKSALVHFLSGGIAAGFVRASLQPLDTCKTRLQASSINPTLRNLSRLLFANGIPGLYKGVIPGVVGIVPAAAVYMLVFQSLKVRLGNQFPRRKNDAVVAVSAGVGDVAASLVRVPCEVLKQRLQVGVYSNVFQALRTVSQAGALTRLYSGLAAQLARDVPYAAVEFVAYENLKAAMIRRHSKPFMAGKPHGPAAARIQQRLQERKLPRAQSFLVGGASGALAAIISNPMDVVKTRLMTQVQQGGVVRYNGVAHAIGKIAREEGVIAFSKGIAPRIVAKTLQSALFFAAYEGLRKSFSKAMNVEVSAKPIH